MGMIINPYAFAAGGGASLAVVGKVLLYTGNGGSQSITGASFSPDLVACVRRNAGNWRWVDNVRGVGLSVCSNDNAAELSEATGLVSFDADGFSLGADTDYNNNTEPHMALVLQEVANAFDIVTYTGNGVSGRTVAHGLGVVPELIITRNRSAAANWGVYPGPLSSPETKFLQFQTSAAVGTSSTVWNNTAPTSSVFTVGNSTAVNQNGSNYVAYLFASVNPGVKVGSYTGNGGTNGPVVTTGFRPQFVLIKRTDATGFWYLFDDQRDPSSPHNTHISTASSLGEGVTTNTAGGVDFLSTGFQTIDVAPVPINESGATYIYLAIN